MQVTTNDLVDRSKNGGGVDKEDAIQNIDAMIARVDNLKRKVSGVTCICPQYKYLTSQALGFE